MNLDLTACKTCFKRATNHVTIEAWEQLPEMLQDQVANALCGPCEEDHLERHL